MNRMKLTSLVLPLVLLGCQAISTGRLAQGTSADRRAADSTVAANLAPRPADVPPTVETTLTSPEAKGAVISTDPEALAQQPAAFGGLVLNVAWPERQATRKTQAIPTTANALWIKVYQGTSFGGPKSAVGAPESGTVLASRVVGRDANDQVPGATPTPCCGPDPNAPKKATLYISLPAGGVTVWVGTFAEDPSAVSSASVYLSSAQAEATIQANKMGSPKAMTLGPNPAIAPSVTQAIPAFVGPGASLIIKGSNFDDEDLKASLYVAPPAGNTCCATKTPLAITAQSSDSLTVTVPKDASSQTYLVQIEAKGFAITSAVEVGILDKNNPFTITVDNSVKQYYPPNQAMEYALPKGGKLTVTALTGRVGCCSSEGPALPLSLVSVIPPDGATTSLDASGSYTAANLGQYRLIAQSGDAKYTQKFNAFNLKFNVDTADCDGCNSRDQMAYPVTTLVSPDCPTCGYEFPVKLYYFIRDGFFVDSDDNPLNNIQRYENSDFTYSSDTLTLGSSRTVTGGSNATGILTASLKASPTLISTASVRVYAPAAVKMWLEWGDTWPNSGFNYAAKLQYVHSSDNTKPELGKDSDFEWTSSDESVATIDAESGQGQILQSATTGQTTTITATLRNDTSKKATATITVK